MGCFDEAMERKREFKRRAKELNDLIALPFEKKLYASLLIIKEALRQHENPVISSSFGKDSIALLHLVRSIKKDIPVAFVNTGVNFRETLIYMRELEKLWNLDLYELHPEKGVTYWKIVEERGFPKQSRNTKTGDKRQPYCCKALKEIPMEKYVRKHKRNLNFVGLTAGENKDGEAEGRQRRWAYILKGSALYYKEADRIWKCIPLIWWSSDDVWQYYKLYDIPKNPAYEKYGIKRTGCIPCTGFRSWPTELQKVNPKMYKLIQHKMGQNLIEDY